MILLYHKIDKEIPTEWWVTADKFYKHLIQLTNKKVVYLDEYDPSNPDHVVITFDGVYKDVLQFAAPLLKKFNYPFELFITGDVIGKSNEFDSVEPNAPFATKKELTQLIAMGGRLQWHTKTHRKIDNLSDQEVKKEIITPDEIKKLDPIGFNWFAYAHGVFDTRSQELVKQHYKGGLACDNGNINDKTIWPRQIITEETELTDEKISIIIPCYNYGHFLVEAIESVLRQTYLPDEILLSDDASTDHSLDIMIAYQKKYPKLIKVNHNKENLGIEKHFNKAVTLTQGSIIGLIGADNRYQSNYIEECLKVLIKNEKNAIAYTDFALFGNRADFMYGEFPKRFRGKKLHNGVLLINFPKFTKTTKEMLFNGQNFIHGSSMYKRKAYNQAGGYQSRSGNTNASSEDYTLFKAMIKHGWLAEKVQNVFLEYRQHSAEQANQQFSYFGEIAFLREQFKAMKVELEALNTKNLDLTQHLEEALNEIQRMKLSKFWKIRNTYHRTRRVIKNPVKSLIKVPRKVKNKITKSS